MTDTHAAGGVVVMITSGFELAAAATDDDQSVDAGSCEIVLTSVIPSALKPGRRYTLSANCPAGSFV